MKNLNAVQLGKLGKGRPKNLTQEERARRRREGIIRLNRWHEKQGHKLSVLDPTK